MPKDCRPLPFLTAFLGNLVPHTTCLQGLSSQEGPLAIRVHTSGCAGLTASSRHFRPHSLGRTPPHTEFHRAHPCHWPPGHCARGCPGFSVLTATPSSPLGHAEPAPLQWLSISFPPSVLRFLSPPFFKDLLRQCSSQQTLPGHLTSTDKGGHGAVMG